MKAVRKLKWKITGVLAIAVLSIVLWQCTNPVDQPALRWASKIDVPMTNDSFFVAEKMKDLFKEINAEKIDILYGGRDPAHTGFYYDTTDPSVLLPEAVRGDTAVFSILRNDSVSYETHEDSMKAQDFQPRLGPITISGAPKYTQTIPVAAGSFSASSNVALARINTLVFDPASPTMQVSVTNLSSNTISNLNVTILGNSTTILSLGPNGTANITVPAGGKAITNSTLRVAISGNATAAGSLQFGFNCNSMIVDSAQIQDSLISFQKQLSNDYELTDTINIDYIDIKEGQFQYIFHNYLHCPIEANITQMNLWYTSYCINNNLTSAASLGTQTPADSDANYFGQLTTGFTRIDVGDSLVKQKTNLAQTRLFPLWNPSLGTNGKSVSRVVYTVKNATPTGAMLTLSANDSILFTIRASKFKFQELAGTVMQAYQRSGDTEKVSVPFPWNGKSKDSLRNHFFLNKVMADLFLTPNLPDTPKYSNRAEIDTMDVIYSAFDPRHPELQKTGLDTIHNAVNKKVNRLSQLDITDIINQWPDSLYVAVAVQVPVGTRLIVINDLDVNDPLYNKYMGRMNIKANISARMNAVLNWTVQDSTSLDLGTGKFKVPKASRYITKMDSLRAVLGMKVTNSSNINIGLYGLAAPKEYILALDSLPLDTLWMCINDSSYAQSRGFVNLFGSRGVSIPPRGETTFDSVNLSEWQLKTLLSSDSAGWRWEAKFRKQPADSLRDTDFILIKSKLTITGNNNMDSLLIWK